MIKYIELVTAIDNISIERFHAHWRAAHRPLVLKISPSAMAGYIQNHRVDDGFWGFKPSGYQGILEIWFPDLAAQQNLLSSPEYLDHARPDEANFLDQENSPLAVAEEHILKGDAVRNPNEARVFLLIRRKSDLSPDRFKNDLLGSVGAQIAASLPSAIRIITTLPSADPIFGHGDHYDAYIALSFPSLRAADVAQGATPALRDALARIADTEHSAAMLSEQIIGRSPY
jgi:uncharacterized protein (TIGR02118 family)